MTSDVPGADPVVARLRDGISEQDRSILLAANRRLELVVELKRHKDTASYGYVDPGRERDLLDRLVAENPGPLSDEGVVELFSLLIALGKREVYGIEREP